MAKHTPTSGTEGNAKEKLRDSISDVYEESKEKAESLYEQTKHKANQLYDEGVKTFCDAEEHLKMYANDLVKSVKEKPLTSLLIAGGIGFIISSLLRK